MDVCGNDGMGTDNEVVMIEDEKKLVDMVAVAGSIMQTALEQIKHDGYSQALMLAAFLETLKAIDVMNPSVDMAVSFNGIVIRNENAADYCE